MVYRCRCCSVWVQMRCRIIYIYMYVVPGRKVQGGEAVILRASYVGVGSVAKQLVYLPE